MTGNSGGGHSVETKMSLRLLRFLSKGAADVQPAAMKNMCLLSNAEHGNLAVPGSLIAMMTEQGIVHLEDDQLHKTIKANEYLKQLILSIGTDSIIQAKSQPQHEIGRKTVVMDGERHEVDYNWAESPLSALFRLNKTSGQRFLSLEEFQAGERLRRDFTRANMMPKISANWELGSTPRAKGTSGGAMQISDMVLASRERVERALAAVGPELSGVLIDICCFLKGIERVERERDWPVRSAKILLKAALSALNRHYSASKPETSQDTAPVPVVLHWGTGDYRPSI